MTQHKRYIDTPHAAQSLACLDFVLDALTSAKGRAAEVRDKKTVAQIANAASALTAAHRTICELAPDAWSHMLQAQAAQQRIDRRRAARTPIDNMGVPNNAEGKNGPDSGA